MASLRGNINDCVHETTHFFVADEIGLRILNLALALIPRMKIVKWEVAFEVNRQQPRSARLRAIQKIPTPIKLLISPLPEMINQICKKYSLENSQDKKTSDDTPENELINSLPV